MKVFMRQSVEQVGVAGEMITVGDGYARNFLLPKGLAVEVTPENEQVFLKRAKTIENRKEVIASQTSLLGEKIKSIKLKIKKKMHDNGQLYGAISAQDIVVLLSQQGVSVSKNQIKFDKVIKSKGVYQVIIQLTTRLQSYVTVDVIAE